MKLREAEYWNEKFWIVVEGIKFIDSQIAEHNTAIPDGYESLRKTVFDAIGKPLTASVVEQFERDFVNVLKKNNFLEIIKIQGHLA